MVQKVFQSSKVPKLPPTATRRSFEVLIRSVQIVPIESFDVIRLMPGKFNAIGTLLRTTYGFTNHDESLSDPSAGKVLQLNASNYDQIDVLL